MTVLFFCFFCVASAEKEDSQGYHPEQTKGTTVTKDLLLKKENTIGHGTAAIPTENTLQHTAAAVTAKFPGAVLSDTAPTASYETTQITKASAMIVSHSGEPFVSRNGQNSLTPTRDNPSATRSRTKSEIPLMPNYKTLFSSSTRAAFKSVMNGTSEQDVHLSTDAVKVSFWLHTLLDNRNQRNTDSITLTSADGGPGIPILSASHPRVIDNLAALRKDNGDKQSQGKDEKWNSSLGRNEYVLSMMQSIFQNDTAEDSLRVNTVTNLCLTCLKDRSPVSTEKSVALLVLSDSLSTEGLTLNLSQFTASLPTLPQQSVGEREEMLNKDIRHQNISKHSSFGVREHLRYKLKFPPLSFKTTFNRTQSVLNNFQINFFLSDPETESLDTPHSLAEMTSTTQGTQRDTKVQATNTHPRETLVTERQISTTAALYRSSKSLHTVRKPGKHGEKEMLGKKVSIGDPHSKLIYSKNNKNASNSLSAKNVFIQNQPLDISSESGSSTPVIADAPRSSQKGFLPEGADHSAASHPTTAMRLTEAHNAITSFSLSRPNTSAVKHPESHSLTGRADSVLRSQMPAKPIPHTKELMLTLLLKDSAIKFASVTTNRHQTDTQDPHTFNTVNSIVKQPFVDPPGPVRKPVMKEPGNPTFTTRQVVVPVKLFLSESSQDFDDVSKLTLTALSSKSFSERLTMSRLLGSQSKITQERPFDVTNDNHVVSTSQSFLKYNRDLRKESLMIHNLQPGDKNEQVLTIAAGDEDKAIIKMEGKKGKEKETKEMLKLQEEEARWEDEKLGSKTELLFRSDMAQSGKPEKIINGLKINQNTDRGEGKMENHEAKTSREDVTSRQNKDPRQEEVRDEGAGEQREFLTKEEAEAGREEAARKEDIKHNREIGREDMTNVPLGPTTNTKELNRDKGHRVTNLSSCHSLIKQLGATEHMGIHPDKNIAQIVEMNTKPFSYKLTSNHRPQHSTLRSQRSKLSRMTSFPKEPYTQIKPHLSTHKAMLTKNGDMSLLTTVNTHYRADEATSSVTVTPKIVPKLFQTFRVVASKFNEAVKPTIYPHSSAAKSAQTALNSITNILSLTTPPLAVTAGFLQAQPHFTVNSSTLSASIIYSISDHGHKFSTSVSKANSNRREQAEHILPAHVVESSVQNPAVPQKMYSDSSTRPPTSGASSFEAHISSGQLQPHQGESAPRVSQSSSFDMTSGQPCSFELSERTADSDALHAPDDDNEQRSVQTLMASMSPKAKNNQFPLRSMSPMLNLMLFGGDNIPGAYSLTGITRSASEKEILRAKSNAEYVNIERGLAESVLGMADEANQTKENDSPQKMATLTNAVKTTLENNLLSQLGYNETHSKTVTFAGQTTHKSEQTINEDFVPVANNSVIPVLDTNYRIGTTAFVELDSLPKIPQIPANCVTHTAISDTEHHAAKLTEKQRDPPTPRGTVEDNTPPVAHNNFSSDLKLLNVSTLQIANQIMNITSDFQLKTTKTNYFVSLAPTARTSGLILPTKAHTSALTTSERVKVAIGESSQAAHAERMVQSNINPLSLKELLATPTSKQPTAVKRNNTTATQSVEEPEYEISVQAIEQSQHTLPGMVAIAHSINVPGVQIGLLNAPHEAGGAHDTTPTMAVEYSSFKDIKTTLKPEARHTQHERTPAVHTLNRAYQHKKHALPEKTSISQVILGAVTDSVPPTENSPIDIINEISCRTIGSAKSGEITKTTGAGEIDHTIPEKMYKTQVGNRDKEHFNAVHTPETKPENEKCNTDCPVPGKAAPQATTLDYAVISPATIISERDHATVETTTRRELLGTDHLESVGALEQGQLLEKTTQRQSHREASETREAVEGEVTLSEPEATTVQTTVKTTERTLFTAEKTKTQLNGGPAKAEIFETQNATRSEHAVSKGETAVQETGRRLLLPEPESESELPRLKDRNRLSPHLYLSG